MSETCESKDNLVKNNRYENSYGSHKDNITDYESSSKNALQSSNCTEISMHFIDRHKSAPELSQSGKDNFSFENPIHCCDSRGFDSTQF